MSEFPFLLTLSLGSLSHVQTLPAAGNGWAITITLTDKAEVDAWRDFFRAAIEGRRE